jgi:site-specific DNA-methyltransferase (adenine-specific)
MADFKDNINQIIQGDCLEIMRLWPDNCVDLVVCSPPYEDARTYGIDFNLKGQDWVDWAIERFIECVRISKGVVAWVVEGKTKQFQWTATPALFMADLHRQGVKLRKPPAFHRIGIPGSGGPDWLRNDYEFIVCASKGKLPWSDNTAMGHPPKWAPGGEMSHRLTDGSKVNQWGGNPKAGNHRKADGSRCKTGRPSHKYHTKRLATGEMETQGYNVPVKANPGNVIKCNVGGGSMGSPLAHENEAPFPERLPQFFIKSFCPESGIVLDCFSGSGTTATVAYENKRNYIGIDVRQSQVDLTNKRLTKERKIMKIEDSCHIDSEEPILYDGDWDCKKQEVYRNPERVLFPAEDKGQ